MSKYCLFLDDERTVRDITWLLLPLVPWIYIRSYDQFVAYITQHGVPAVVSFDHDLGLGETGYDCAKWLAWYCLDNAQPIPDFYVHSQNPVGSKNITEYLKNARKVQALREEISALRD